MTKQFENQLTEALMTMRTSEDWVVQFNSMMDAKDLASQLDEDTARELARRIDVMYEEVKRV